MSAVFWAIVLFSETSAIRSSPSQLTLIGTPSIFKSQEILPTPSVSMVHSSSKDASSRNSNLQATFTVSASISAGDQTSTSSLQLEKGADNFSTCLFEFAV